MPLSKNKIVITAGEPAGIGADLCLDLPAIADTELYVIADPDLLVDRMHQLSINKALHIHTDLTDLSNHYQNNAINVIALKLQEKTRTGQLNSNNSGYVLAMLNLACDMCMQHQADAMVTGPLQKSVINQAGYTFTGHTEYLAQRASTDTPIAPVMMLATKNLRVALATTHLPLKDVSQAITADSLRATLRTLNNFLIQQAGISNPSILVCGLNPHAGEDGNLGREEIDTIIPVVEQLKNEGLQLTGPLPADTLFTAKYLDHADAVLAMYHDQGLPVLKYSGFGKAVNVTLGLPFIRTSVDHGTALDLAGTGKASNSSLLEAIDMAIELCRNKH